MPTRLIALPSAHWHVMADVCPTTNVDFIDFIGLDINRDRFYKLFVNLRNSLTVVNNYRVFINDDFVIGNYRSQMINIDHVSIGSERLNIPNFSISQAGECILLEGIFCRDINGFFRLYSCNNWQTPASVGMIFYTVSRILTSPNITMLRIQSGVPGGGIGAGSMITLCRLRS